jgi:hypothetical protein
MDVHDTQTDLAETLRRAALARDRAHRTRTWSAYDEHCEQQCDPLTCDYCHEERE